MRRARSSRSSESSGGTVGHIARDALNIGKFLLELLNVELKWYDGTFSTSLSAAGGIIWLTSPAAGTGPSNRTGSSILCKSLLLRYQLYPNLTTLGATPYSYQARVIVFFFKNKDAVAAAPAVTDVLDSASPASNMNMQNRGAFIVLHDKLHAFSTYESAAKLEEHYIDMNHHITWDATGDAITDIRDGHIFVLVIQDQNYGTAAGLVMDWNSRIRFIDN